MTTTVQQQEMTLSSLNHKGSRRRFSLTPYLFILPHLIFFALFVGYPFLNGLYISLFQYDYLQTVNPFVGLRNYTNLFTAGTVEFQVFWNALRNTLEFVL